uniref:Uncharacterized protein n=1 Tax=Ciona intestinalis TaxID=7719 RepID=H2XL91_CIOIN
MFLSIFRVLFFSDEPSPVVESDFVVEAFGNCCHFCLR